MHNSPLYAAIDLGSNSIHMLVVREVAGALRTVTKVKRKVRLAAGLDPEFRLSRAAMERGWDCLRLFSEQLQDIPADNIRVVGTATLRLATNVDEFRDLLDAADNLAALLAAAEVLSDCFDEAQRIYDDKNNGDNNVVAQTPAHQQRQRQRQRVLSRGRGQGNRIIPSFICC